MGFDLGTAVQGALGGASAGSALGGYGALGGGVLGFFGGGFLDGGESEEDKIRKALWKQAEEGDPLAREQLRQQTARMVGMQQAMAAAAPRGQQGLAARTASQTAGRQGMAMAGEAAQADVAARLGALNALGGMGQTKEPSFLDYLLQTGSTVGQLKTLFGAGAGVPGGGGGMDLGAMRSALSQPMTLQTPGDQGAYGLGGAGSYGLGGTGAFGTGAFSRGYKF